MHLQGSTNNYSPAVVVVHHHNHLVLLHVAHTHDIHHMPSALLCLTIWSCRPYAEKYAESQDAFFEDYAKAHLKLSELGVKWDPEPIEFDV